jgi:hypothetical protein
MRRLTAWIGGVAGGVVAYRLWRRHTEPAPEPYPDAAPAEPDDRADELRAKLAESREATATTEPVVEEPEVEEPPAESPAEDQPESPEERRQRVYDEGRATLDEMKSD